MAVLLQESSVFNWKSCINTQVIPRLMETVINMKREAGGMNDYNCPKPQMSKFNSVVREMPGSSSWDHLSQVSKILLGFFPLDSWDRPQGCSSYSNTHLWVNMPDQHALDARADWLRFDYLGVRVRETKLGFQKLILKGLGDRSVGQVCGVSEWGPELGSPAPM